LNKCPVCGKNVIITDNPTEVGISFKNHSVVVKGYEQGKSEKQAEIIKKIKSKYPKDTETDNEWDRFVEEILSLIEGK
jgi:cytochrome c-type biogenesis protein CcmH/NrfF